MCPCRFNDGGDLIVLVRPRRGETGRAGAGVAFFGAVLPCRGSLQGVVEGRGSKV